MTKLLDQARALIEARGVPGRERDGFALMKKIADEGEGQAAVLAQWNVANFYLNGIGTEPSKRPPEEGTARLNPDGSTEIRHEAGGSTRMEADGTIHQVTFHA